MERVAASMMVKSGRLSASTTRGTTMTTASAQGIASAYSVVARRAPEEISGGRYSARCASPGKGSSPPLIRATVCGFTSTPTTLCPPRA